MRVIVTEETDWIGGQLTSQAVPPDENAWIESFGGTRSYLQLRRKIREFYYRNYPLTAEARAHPYLNPGYGWVSRLCCEPRAGLAALQEMLAPHQSSQRIQILLQHVATAAETDGDAVKAVDGQLILSRTVTNSANKPVHSCTFINTYSSKTTGGGSGSGSGSGSGVGGPKTGDDLTHAPYSIALAISLLAAFLCSGWLVLLRKRKEGRDAGNR
ncbi:hypothetical protein SDC9_173614 [bioreactor metagenome]|uniref:Uncharacterized protein n=1 Tax=bioreactor metagenome TaxID=1076179 RepID=A0A645GJ63_9ZZZZ